MKIILGVCFTVLGLAFVMVIVAMVSAGGHGSGASSFDAYDDQQDVIRECQASVKTTLKDPDSAQFESWTASKSGSTVAGPSTRERYYTARGMVNAKNGFGGYDGYQPYTCTATVTDDKVDAQARPVDLSTPAG